MVAGPRQGNFSICKHLSRTIKHLEYVFERPSCVGHWAGVHGVSGMLGPPHRAGFPPYEMFQGEPRAQPRTSRSLLCPHSTMTEDWLGASEGVGSPGMEDEETEEGRDSCPSLMRSQLEPEEELKADGALRPSLWQEAEQEAKQQGSCEAVGLQGSCLGP